MINEARHLSHQCLNLALLRLILLVKCWEEINSKRFFKLRQNWSKQGTVLCVMRSKFLCQPHPVIVWQQSLRNPCFYFLIPSGVGICPLYCDHFWSIVPARDGRWRWLWSNWWNENWQGKPKYSEKTCPSVTFSTTNPTWADPGSNPGRRGGKPATNHLSYGTALGIHLAYVH
jgi:hypothetical protein